MSEAQCFSTCWVFCYFLFFSNPGSGAQGRGDIKGIHLNLRGTKNLEEGLSLPSVASGPHDVRTAHLGHDGEVKLVGAVISFNTLYHLTEVALIHYVKEKLKYYEASIVLF